jgi:CMP/dCMP kinase
MIISFMGLPGSGKSTVAKLLAEKLNWPRYYIGGLRRQKAKDRGMTLAEYNKLGETDPQTDLEVDNYQTELGKTEDNFIIEGRTSWYFIPHSFKIYLDVNKKIGAQRIYNDLEKSKHRNEDVNLKTADDVLKSIKEREKSDAFRYKKYFGINVHDKKNYDLIIDTSNMAPDEIVKKIINFLAAS